MGFILRSFFFFFLLCGVLRFYNLLLSGRGTKRKFAFDSTAAEKVAQEAEEAALRQIEREQAAALRSKLPDFWLPSLTPTYTSSGPPSSLADVKVRTTCRGGNPPHPIAYAWSTRIYTSSLFNTSIQTENPYSRQLHLPTRATPVFPIPVNEFHSSG